MRWNIQKLHLCKLELKTHPCAPKDLSLLKTNYERTNYEPIIQIQMWWNLTCSTMASQDYCL